MKKDTIEVPRRLLEVINHMASGFAFNQREKDIIAEVDALLNPPPDPEPNFTAEEVDKWGRDLMEVKPVGCYWLGYRTPEDCFPIRIYRGDYWVWTSEDGWIFHATTEDKVKLNEFFERKRNER